jgi:ribosomal protein S18 acetylase RimI-like enzyme
MTLTTAFVIRQMLPEDAAAVAGLTSQLGYPATESEIKRRFDRIKDRWDARLFVAKQPEHLIVGWIHVQATYLLEADPRAEIWGLVVAEGARGLGVGRALVEAAEEWAGRLNLDVVVVRSNQVRVRARGFYEHLGYTVTKTQHAFRKTLG